MTFEGKYMDKTDNSKLDFNNAHDVCHIFFVNRSRTRQSYVGPVLASCLLTVLMPVDLLFEMLELASALYLRARFLQQGNLPKHRTNP